MDVQQIISEQVILEENKVYWSRNLRTKSHCRVAIITSDSLMHDHMDKQGYPHVFLIDYGNEICIESYNDDGEWNVGEDHPLNLETF